MAGNTKKSRKLNTLNLSGKGPLMTSSNQQHPPTVSPLVSVVMKDIEEEKKADVMMEDTTTDHDQLVSVAKGLIDLKEYAPHILE